ncbi:MAG: sigma-70 family RNA polymerase sigma factor [Bryobacterales bacterium]|nr:sigma-70 family RNA polymerase sigma factor [Bryobacterales bacterium]
MAIEGNITQLLANVRDGDRDSQKRLMEAVYEELHRLATGYMRRERPDHTLQASALVNEAYVRLIGNGPLSWESRAHFFVTAAQTMRRVLIDHARRHLAEKRGGAGLRIELNENIVAVADTGSGRMLDLDRALTRLAELDPRQAKVVELRFFAGLTVEQTAEVLSISEKTVKRDWAVARAWLEGEITGSAL